MTLHTHLKAHHTVRISDGVEVEKPELYEMFEGQTRDNAFRTLSEDTCKNALLWENATEVIKLPNWMEFVSELQNSKATERISNLISTSNADWLDYSKIGGKKYEIIVSYKELLSKIPTLSEFVPVGENGEVLEEPYAWKEYLNPNKSESPDWNPVVVEECFAYEAALSNVIYEGWEVLLNNDYTKTIGNKKGFIIAFLRNGSIEIQGKSSRITVKTTDELNREVQLYLKIK